MKFHAKLTVLLLALTILPISSCLSNNATIKATVTDMTEPGTDIGFSSVAHRNWILAEIRSATETITLDRDRNIKEGFGHIFTLRFEDTIVFGKGAPNTYRGPYTLADKQAIAFGQMATTMMAAFREPEELTEHQFFVHMSHVMRWKSSEGNLELLAIDEDNAEVVLVFVAQDD